MAKFLIIVLLNLLLFTGIYKNSLIEVYELEYHLNLEALKPKFEFFNKLYPSNVFELLKQQLKRLKSSKYEEFNDVIVYSNGYLLADYRYLNFKHYRAKKHIQSAKEQTEQPNLKTEALATQQATEALATQPTEAPSTSPQPTEAQQPASISQQPTEAQQPATILQASEVRSLNNLSEAKKLIIERKSGVILLGDSLMQGLAARLCHALAKQHTPCENLAKQSSGLLHQRFYNYSKIMQTAMAANPRAKVIVLAGVNDLFDTYYHGKKINFGSLEWAQRYKELLMPLKNIAAWIALPPLRKDKGASKAKWFNEQIAPQIRQMGALWIEIEDKEFNYYDQINGELIKVRANDGVHFSTAGYEMLAKRLLSHIEFR